MNGNGIMKERKNYGIITQTDYFDGKSKTKYL